MLVTATSNPGDMEQVLASALNANLFPFVLDLACLAAKREFLKLDKWITDKIKDNQVKCDDAQEPCMGLS